MDFKSGPLNVSLTTKIILMKISSFESENETYDKAFYISPLDDQARNISHVNLVVPKSQWNEIYKQANVQQSQIEAWEKVKQPIDILFFENFEEMQPVLEAELI